MRNFKHLTNFLNRSFSLISLLQGQEKEKVKENHTAKADTNPNQTQLISSIKMVNIWMINLVAVWEAEGYYKPYIKDF